MDSEENKYALKKETVKYRQALEEELDKWVGSAKNVGRNALFIGCTLTVSYLLVRKLTKTTSTKEKKSVNIIDSSSKSEKESSLFDQVSAFVLKELSIYLLMYAKEKILKYIETLKDEDE